MRSVTCLDYEVGLGSIYPPTDQPASVIWVWVNIRTRSNATPTRSFLRLLVSLPRLRGSPPLLSSTSTLFIELGVVPPQFCLALGCFRILRSIICWQRWQPSRFTAATMTSGMHG